MELKTVSVDCWLKTHNKCTEKPSLDWLIACHCKCHKGVKYCKKCNKGLESWEERICIECEVARYI